MFHLLRDPRIACLVIAAITGAVPYDPRDRAAWARVQAILREAWSLPAEAEAQRRDVIAIALDAIEEAGLHEPEAWPTDAGVSWPKVRHVCRWFARGRFKGFEIPLSGRCTCGAREMDVALDGAIENEQAGSHRFRYADGRVEWHDVDARGGRLTRPFVLRETRRASRTLADAMSEALAPVARHTFHPFRIRQDGFPDIVEFHEHGRDPGLRRHLEEMAANDVRRERDAVRPRARREQCILRAGHRGSCEVNDFDPPNPDRDRCTRGVWR